MAWVALMRGVRDRSMRTTCATALLWTALCTAAGCRGTAPQRAAAPSAADDLRALLAANDAALAAAVQVLVVVGGEGEPRCTAAWYERETTGAPWRRVAGPLPASVGVNGFAPRDQKREGDRRTPSGAFTLTETFGAAPVAATQLPYRQATAEDAWSEDPNSPQYNQWIKVQPAEPGDRLARSDDLYDQTIVVDYNRWPAAPGAGSAIFIHRAHADGSGTLGCVGLEAAPLDALFRWLRPAPPPVILMGTPETLRRGVPAPPPPEFPESARIR